MGTDTQKRTIASLAIKRSLGVTFVAGCIAIGLVNTASAQLSSQSSQAIPGTALECMQIENRVDTLIERRNRLVRSRALPEAQAKQVDARLTQAVNRLINAATNCNRTALKRKFDRALSNASLSSRVTQRARVSRSALKDFEKKQNRFLAQSRLGQRPKLTKALCMNAMKQLRDLPRRRNSALADPKMSAQQKGELSLWFAQQKRRIESYAMACQTAKLLTQGNR